MILTLDVGNTQIYGGLFKDDKIIFQFRKNSANSVSSDELGLFLRSVLKENGHDPEQIRHVAVCTVVPLLAHSIKNCCRKYFNTSPFFLKAGTKTGLKIKYRNPIEVGADRIANAIAASEMYPDRDFVIVDQGTATTFDVLTKNREYLGGAIMSGLRLSMESLEAKTAKLPIVEILAAENAVGRSTVESIQSGLYFGQLGAIKEMVLRITEESFKGEPPMVIGTGGFAGIFEKEKIFDVVHSDLVLRGLYRALMINI